MVTRLFMARGAVLAFAALGVAASASADSGPSALRPAPADAGVNLAFCAVEPDPPPYYAFELVTTKNVPGTGLATGVSEVTHAASPFSVSLAPDGSYRYDLHIELGRMRVPRTGTLVAWVTTREIDQIRRIGALDENLQAKGQVEWNKFLVVITLEDEDDATAERWSGPIAFRGMSRSGLMHTMAGHGALQQENCAAYGYAN